MHTIEPFYRWENLYSAAADPRSPFYGHEPNIMEYTNDIYGYYIHPYWDFIGSETLYIKLLYTHYQHRIAIIELMGEWNDAIHNDIMHLKRNVVDYLLAEGIQYFILIGDNIFNFHGSDDCYYEEWFEELDEGWIVTLCFRQFVIDEWKQYNIDSFFNYGGGLDIQNWRTMQPLALFRKVQDEIRHRLA